MIVYIVYINVMFCLENMLFLLKVLMSCNFDIYFRYLFFSSLL